MKEMAWEEEVSHIEHRKDPGYQGMTFERHGPILFCFWILIDLRKTLQNRRHIGGGTVLQQGRALLLSAFHLVWFHLVRLAPNSWRSSISSLWGAGIASMSHKTRHGHSLTSYGDKRFPMPSNPD